MQFTSVTPVQCYVIPFYNNEVIKKRFKYETFVTLVKFQHQDRDWVLIPRIHSLPAVPWFQVIQDYAKPFSPKIQ